MSIAGLNNTVVPSMLAGSPQLTTGTPLMTQGGVLPSAALGIQEKPGILTRLGNAMKAAVGELRGTPTSSAITVNQQLAMQAMPQPVAAPTVDKPVKKGMRAKSVKSAKTWKTLKNPPKQQAQVPTAGVAQPAGNALPANATQLPGATVYSYDGNGNPAVAGLAGLSPQMQQQLGMSPTMLQGINGIAQAVDPSGPQVNATNQTNLSGLGTGMGMGMGSMVPVLGAPIVTAPATSTGPGDSAGSTGGTQSVTNRNTSDSAANHQGVGYGYGSPWGMNSGIATPYTPYGASMTGAYALPGTTATTGGVGGFFSRLLGS